MQSWGLYPNVKSPRAIPIASRGDPFPKLGADEKALPYGLGRSYGDSCLNDRGPLLLTRALRHLMAFDEASGVLTCEAGTSFAEILDWAVPRGWFLPVTPGTKYVTVGGAIANDVHGKNHHAAGSFGNHVVAFELLRSDGSRLLCSDTENTGFFRATIGGLGLTGLITWASFKLIPIEGPSIDQETVRFGSADEFHALSSEKGANYPYTVAWIDTLARGKQIGRGHFISGRHAASASKAGIGSRGKSAAGVDPKIGVPFFFPNGVLNSLSVRAFNFAYYWRKPKAVSQAIVPYDPFFYPLDAIRDWNRIYGKNGFLQYQLVVPSTSDGREAIREVLETTAKQGLGSFLSVMKTFGSIASKGLLSFPRPGITLTLDFPVGDGSIFPVLASLDSIVFSVGGALYPAKDARMSGAAFRKSFSRLEEFSRHIDPKFTSHFWERVQG